MCRRYVSPDEASIEREFALEKTGFALAINFNAAPLQILPVIRWIEGRPAPASLRWGLGYHSRFNARMETLASNASYRDAWKAGQRCLVPALGFYEWQIKADGTKQPLYIQVEDQDIFGFAGLWNGDSFTIVTLPANTLIAEIHDAKRRMPAILTRDARDVWLAGGSPDEAAVLRAYPSDRLVAYAVSTRVNFAGNNDETLIEPLETNVD